MKSILRLGLAIAAVFGVATAVPAQEPALKVAFATAEPFGGEAGVFIDIMDAVRETGGFNFTYERFPIGEHIAALVAGRVDIMATPLGMTEERRSQGLEYTIPIFSFGEGLIVPAADPVAHVDLSKLTGSVGFVTGATIYENMIKAAGLTPRGYATPADLFAGVSAGEITAALYPKTSFAFLQTGGKFADLRLAETYITVAPV